METEMTNEQRLKLAHSLLEEAKLLQKAHGELVQVFDGERFGGDLSLILRMSDNTCTGSLSLAAESFRDGSDDEGHIAKNRKSVLGPLVNHVAGLYKQKVKAAYDLMGQLIQ